MQKCIYESISSTYIFNLIHNVIYNPKAEAQNIVPLYSANENHFFLFISISTLDFTFLDRTCTL